MNRKDPRMAKPFIRLNRSCAAGLNSCVANVRVFSYNRMIRRERMRIDLAQAQFVAIPRLVTPAGFKMPKAIQAKRK